jgi:hypothetical protein
MFRAANIGFNVGQSFGERQGLMLSSDRATEVERSGEKREDNAYGNNVADWPG